MSVAPTVSAFGFSGPDYVGWNRQKVLENRAAEDAFNRTREMQDIDMTFQREMSNTAYQRATADMKAAGINPMLAVSQGGASTPPGAFASAAMAHRGPPPGVGGTTGIQTAQMGEKILAEANLSNAQAEATRATYPVTIDSLKQGMTESNARIQDIYSAITKRGQEVVNLQAQLPQIQAETQKLLQQARNYAANTSLTRQEDLRMQQIVKQNLPALEAAGIALDNVIKEWSLPGHRNDQAAQDSLTGQIGAYWKALQGMGNAIGIGAALGQASKFGREAVKAAAPLINKR